jgi:hypothetical protein
MELFLSSIYIAFFSWLILQLRFFKVEGISPWIFVGIFFIKLLSALVLTLIYTYYYTDRTTADIFKYFDDAKVIFSALHKNPVDYLKMISGIGADSANLKHYYLECNFWYKEFNYMLYNDNRTIIRFNAIIMLFSFGKFFVHNVFMSFLSLIGLMGIYRVFVSQFVSKKWELLVAIFLLPSVLLWTSGTLKEGLVMFAFGLFFYSFWYILNHRFILKHLLICFSMLFILSLAKFYVILCAVPSILFLLIKQFSKFKSSILILLFSFGICFTGLFVGRIIGGSLDVINTLTYKHNDFVTFSLSLDKVGSLMDTSLLKPTLVDFAKHIPDALYKSLFKPFPWDIKNVMSILPAFENSILLLLILLVFIKRNKPIVSKDLLLFSFCFVLCLNILNGLIVPVFGALVRYKVPALPFLFASLVCIIDFDFLQIKKLFLFVKK